ncbi:putative bifunctional diguanylate cyclase/phosphodiesterase [Thaumasiovibrio subtropicus]|uniref:putative bifunctional diguanylate cyclase/phosphodiesterase n=1 Tax=Thaumasiovibrio subtropicus TaxID=1891207 RepID=UPI000B35B865|nr:bifunctional diguanylate cyclase/phosphodiesterase [Thaumasiovibrio subtropicus]
MRRRGLSVTAKIMMLVNGALITVVIALLWLFFMFETGLVKASEEANLNSLVDVVSPSLKAALLFDDVDTIQDILSSLRALDSIDYVAVVDHNNRVIHDIGISVVPVEGGAILPEYYQRLFYDDGRLLATLIVAKSENYLGEQFVLFSNVLVAVFFIFILVSVIFSYTIQHIISSPIKRLTSVVKGISESGEYMQRASIDTRDEVGELAKYFNAMMDEVSQRDKWMEEQVSQRTKQLEASNQKLFQLAYTDPLTKLANRSRFISELDYYTQIGRSEPFALLFIDLDKFKTINDNLGHEAGDQLLVETANRLVSAMGKDDIVARLGGDEFVIMHFGYQSLHELRLRCEHLRQQFLAPFVLQNRHLYVSVSVGVAEYPKDGRESDLLVKNADEAMYVAKSKGRNRVGYYEPSMGAVAAIRMNLTQDLRLALNRGEFEIHYQPIVDMKTGEWVKLEALLRWQHPTRGIIYPNEFVPHAEENGMISEIGRWVFMQSAIYCRKLYELTGRWFSISVNISPVQFNDKPEDYHDYVKRFMRLRLPEGALIIEITEGLLMDVDEGTSDLLSGLRRLGVQLAIDDFGTGYSSLSYLRKFDIDLLKIDRSFVESIADSQDDCAICEAIITMSHALGIAVVAEGIETQNQIDVLNRLGCDYGQGYLFSLPIIGDALLVSICEKQGVLKLTNRKG